MSELVILLGLSLAKVVVIVLGFVMVLATVLTWAERRQSAMIQNRVGPNTANIGPFKMAGLFHPIADAIKTLMKEDVIPDGVDKVLHTLAPFIALFPVMAAFAVVPFGEVWCDGTVSVAAGRDVCTDGKVWNLFQIADLHVGILYIFAISSIGVYGVVLAGWASRSKFPLMGGLRAGAQMISYEVTLGLSVIGVLMVFSSVGLQELVRGQGDLLWGWLPKWGLFVQPLGAALFFAAGMAETKRAPFDMPEAESELVAGYFTEYSSLKFAMFSLGEFIEVVLLACVFATLFLGGWQVPWLRADGFHFPNEWVGPAIAGLMVLIGITGMLGAVSRKTGLLAVFVAPMLILGLLLLWAVNEFSPNHLIAVPYWAVHGLRIGSAITKILFLCWLQLMFRWTLPRFRYDQVMRLTWRYILPLSLLNILITGVVLVA